MQIASYTRNERNKWQWEYQNKSQRSKKYMAPLPACLDWPQIHVTYQTLMTEWHIKGVVCTKQNPL